MDLRQLAKEVAVTYSSLLIALIYPIGMLKLWIQVTNYYTGDSVTAWYAASLVPKTVAMGQALHVVIFALLASITALLASTLVVTTGFALGWIKYKSKIRGPQKCGKTTDRIIEMSGFRSALLREFFTKKWMRKRWFRWTVLITPWLMLVATAALVGVRHVADGGLALAFYVGFVLISIGTAGVAGYLIAYKPTIGELSFVKTYSLDKYEAWKYKKCEQEFLNLARERWKQSSRRWRRIGLTLIAVGAVLSSLCLIEATYVFLPSVRFTENGKTIVIDTLSLSGSSWQGFNCSGELVSVRGEDAEDVTIFADSGPPYSHCPVHRVTEPTVTAAPQAPPREPRGTPA